MNKQVLVGKVLVKAGADKATLQMLKEVFARLEMDRKAMTLATSLPSLQGMGDQGIEEEVAQIPSDLEKPVILFSILDRVGSDAEARGVAHTWQERIRKDNDARRLLLGSIESSVTPSVRWLRWWRGGRNAFSPLEKLFMLMLVFQLLGGGSWNLIRGSHASPGIPTPVAHVALPVRVLALPAPVVPDKSMPLKAYVRPKSVPSPKLGDLVYFSGGKVKLLWKSVGKGYRYQVYIAKDAHLKDAHPVSTKNIFQTEFVWTKSTAANWLAVKTIDPAGRQSAFSEATYVGLY